MKYFRRVAPILVSISTLSLILSASAAASTANEISTASPRADTASASMVGRFGATYLDPYSVFNASDARLNVMFESQAAAGIDSVIVQWTGAMQSSGKIVTTYPAGVGTGFGAWDSVLPRLLAAAERHGVDVWLGLVLKSNALDDPGTRDDAELLGRIAEADAIIADDLLDKYEGQFSGWYIPTEPGYQTVSDSARLALHTDYVTHIADRLDQLPKDLPVMISPSVPRAIEGNMSGTQFIEALRPMIETSGVDVWNLQDGYKMTAWSPQQNRELVEKGQEIAATVGAQTWVTLYTPGPGDANYPLTPSKMLADLDAVTTTGATATMWTFDSAMNPDPTRTNSAPRAELYDTYRTATGQ